MEGNGVQSTKAQHPGEHDFYSFIKPYGPPNVLKPTEIKWNEEERAFLLRVKFKGDLLHHKSTYEVTVDIILGVFLSRLFP